MTRSMKSWIHAPQLQPTGSFRGIKKFWVADPVIATAVFVTALNDHFLKGAGILPSALTGKISDFSGMFFIGFFLADLCGIARPSARFDVPLFICLNLMSMVAFTLLKTYPPAAQAYSNAYYRFFGMTVRVVPDISDLWALLAIPFAVKYFLLGQRTVPSRADVSA